MIVVCHYHLNFFDPRWTSEKKPYAPERFRDIVEERYLISNYIHTSYLDTASISPTERTMLLQLIKDDLQRKYDKIEEIRSNQNNKR